ncbi:iron chelate uptake ABC transporter family permease subunit [Eubacterium limosum]|uniref:iron chelate uptake ABC transporter family permease subunit n=1 Tax=Eubacterium limosum TaxID=1736 RepID=UPI0029F53C39|nr:iron chelate uptake ABC transporter family permease subunit [Eubacterium limosum]
MNKKIKKYVMPISIIDRFCKAIIGFVGLVVPHVVRMLTGPKHCILFPISLVFGGTFFIV